jgi:DNA replication and repair protein RecF
MRFHPWSLIAFFISAWKLIIIYCMLLTHLSLTNFRNFSRLDLDVPGGILLLVGANAQGKTSLLEAVYFLATFVSFHAASDRQLVNLIAAKEPLAVTRIVGDFCRQEASGGMGTHRIEVRIIQENNGINGGRRVRKEVLLDGLQQKISEVVGQFNAVLFLPQTMRIIEGSPEDRRRFLNLTLAQVVPHYAATLSDYSRTLTRRNALLKQISERQGDPGQLAYWDQRLASLGGRIIWTRIHALQELESLATGIHNQLTHGNEVLRLSYQPAFDPLPQTENQFALPLDTPTKRTHITEEQIEAGFLEKLTGLQNEEIARGMTTIGPHRDEVRFLGNGIDLGTYGSRGQARTALLALRLAEVSWMRDKTGQWPVLLLDEVLAELDTQRRLDLLSRLTESEQALLTTTDLDLFAAIFVNQATLWRVQEGRVT